MRGSVRFGLVERSHRICDQFIKLISKGLSKYQIHSKSCADVCFGLVRAVSNNRGKRYSDHAVTMAVLNEKIGNSYRNSAVDNFKLGVTHSEQLAAPNSDFVRQNINLLGNQTGSIGPDLFFKSQGGAS